MRARYNQCPLLCADETKAVAINYYRMTKLLFIIWLFQLSKTKGYWRDIHYIVLYLFFFKLALKMTAAKLCKSKYILFPHRMRVVLWFITMKVLKTITRFYWTRRNPLHASRDNPFLNLARDLVLLLPSKLFLTALTIVLDSPETYYMKLSHIKLFKRVAIKIT